MFKKVLEYTKEYKKYTYISIVLIFIAVIAQILPYFFAFQLIKELLALHTIKVSNVLWALIGIAISLLVHAILYIKGLAYSHYSAYHTLKNLRISMQAKLEKLPLGVIQEKGVGSLKKIFVDDIENIELLLAHALPEGIANISVPLILYLLMFVVDYKLALLSLVPIVIGIVAMMMMYRQGTSKMDEYYGVGRKMNQTIIEYVNGMDVVKVFNRVDESFERFRDVIIHYRDFTIAWFKMCWPWMALYNSIIPCIVLFTLPVGSYFVLNGTSSLSNLILILCMSSSVGAPLIRALGFMSTMPQINYRIQTIEDVLSSAPLKEGTHTFEGDSYDVNFENVSFAYEEDEVLHNINLDIKKNSLTAFVGESGSGKSTLAKLLVHYYDINSGTIKIGNQDICNMDLKSLNDLVSYVSQEQFLFNTTIYDNIKIGNLDASEKDIMEAASKAQCDDFIQRLENGIHSSVGDSGKQLSGGERQRIALARAILKDAPIIVLDEATAFVDPENEEKMNKAIGEVLKHKTVIMIAHRLTSIQDADQICVLKEGNVCDRGKHKDLLQRCEEYRTLYEASIQSASWKVEG